MLWNLLINYIIMWVFAFDFKYNNNIFLATAHVFWMCWEKMFYTRNECSRPNSYVKIFLLTRESDFFYFCFPDIKA